MADANVPGLGKMPKWAIWTTIGVGGVVVYYIYKRQSNASAATTASTATDTSNIDPATGYPYGSAEDDAALAAQANSSLGGYDAYGGAYNGAYGAYGATGTTPTSTAPVTNAAWSQEVEQTLSAIGYDPVAVSGALGRYLASLPLSSDQANIVQVALAEDGPPPQGTYSIIPQGTGSTGGGTSGGGGSTGGSARLSAPSGMRISGLYTNSAQVSWNSVSGAAGYTAQLKQGGDNGNTVSGPFKVTNPVANFGGLRSKTHYTALIWPNGPGSQPHSEIGFTTK